MPGEISRRYEGPKDNRVPSWMCLRCGYPRDEHHYNGACYGLCGEFVPPSSENSPETK